MPTIVVSCCHRHIHQPSASRPPSTHSPHTIPNWIRCFHRNSILEWSTETKCQHSLQFNGNKSNVRYDYRPRHLPYTNIHNGILRARLHFFFSFRISSWAKNELTCAAPFISILLQLCIIKWQSTDLLCFRFTNLNWSKNFRLFIMEDAIGGCAQNGCGWADDNGARWNVANRGWMHSALWKMYI